MAKKNKLNSSLALVCAVLFFVIGIVAGVIGKIYLNGLETYYIPEKYNASQKIAEGSVDANVVKGKDLSIHFLELGNKYTGDCTFIKVGNTEILIDAGSRMSSVNPIYEYIHPYIEDDKLEYVIVTHAHRDHYACFATSDYNDSLFAKLDCEIETVITYSNTNQTTAKMFEYFNENLEVLESQGTKIVNALDCYNNTNGGQRVYALENNVELQILYHRYYEEDAHSENDYSVACMINQQDKHYLFTGDLEETGESSLVDSYFNEYGVDLPKVALYKAGHHGSKTSSSTKLLNKIDPDVVCICCCAGSSEYTSTNENQFPTQTFIDRIAPYTDKIYVTTLSVDYKKGSFESMNGNIVVTCDNDDDTIAVACFNNNLILKETDWFKKNRKMPTNWIA